MTKGEDSAGSLTARSVDFPRWYQEVVAGAELAEGGPVRGTMVIRPWGFGIWELLVAELDRRIKQAGAQNAYFPLFIPGSFLSLEADHVEGFSPELAVVTMGGGKELEEPVVVRPTSETMVNHFFAQWIHSHRDLPLAINQWSNVVRWEMRTRILLRTTELLWQEGHTAHATESEAAGYARRILRDVYVQTCEDVMRIPVLTGEKTERERFAGAVRTWTCEAMMGDGKALQMATSHELGQNFARPFKIQYADEEGQLRYVFQTSWGASTRLLGALVMVHGDDFGLRLPPALAPTQVVVMMVRSEEATATAAQALASELAAAGIRVKVDSRTDLGFGRRSIDWERKGVPVRVEIGPKDLASEQAVVVSRWQRSKRQVPLSSVRSQVEQVLRETTEHLYLQADAFAQARSQEVSSMAEVLEAAGKGFVTVPASGLGDGMEDSLTEAGLGVRCLVRPDRSLHEIGETDLVAVVARSY
ncbi:MAG: proline--tRNA ligase [Acidimicrobiales bacterium]